MARSLPAAAGHRQTGRAPGVARRLRLAIPLLVLAGLVAAGGCSPKPPPDPGLAGEDLGIGISLGMDPAAAKEAAPKASHSTEVWVLTPQELNKRNPYEDRAADKDLVVALYLPFITPGSTPDDPLGSGRIKELRCYLGEPAKSRLTLLGRRAASLTQDELTTLCGPPRETTYSPDNDTHLSYRFSPPQDGGLGPNVINLMASFHSDGVCYALSIALEPR